MAKEGLTYSVNGLHPNREVFHITGFGGEITPQAAEAAVVDAFSRGCVPQLVKHEPSSTPSIGGLVSSTCNDGLTQVVERGRVGALMAQIDAGLVVLDAESQGIFERHYPVIMTEMNATAAQIQTGLQYGPPKEDAWWGGPHIERSLESVQASVRADEDLHKQLVDSNADLQTLAVCMGYTLVENRR